MSNESYSYVYIYAGMVAKGLGKGKRYYKPPTGGRRWRPGTQALREVHQAMLSTNLCIPRLPFLWYVYVGHVERNNVQYSTCNTLLLVYVEHVEHLINTSVVAGLSGR